MLQIIQGEFSLTGDDLPPLPVGGASPGSCGGGAAVGGNRSIMLGRHGRAYVPDACANHVRKAVF